MDTHDFPVPVTHLYTVITCGDSVSFSQQVEKALAKGWMLQGGVAISFTDSGNIRIYAQALTKAIRQIS